MDGHAANNIQMNKRETEGAGAGSFSASTRAMLLRLRHAKIAQVNTNTTYNADQQYDCHWVGSIGSNAIG